MKVGSIAKIPSTSSAILSYSLWQYILQIPDFLSLIYK